MVAFESRSRAWWAVGLIAAYLLLAFAWQDLPLYDFDDAMYLASGMHVHASMFANDLTSMPLYALWFKVLAAVCHDALWRQFLSWGLMVLVVGLLPALRRVPLAWAYAAALVALPFFSIEPYVSLFAAMFFVAAMVWLLRRRVSFAVAAAVACAACFAVAYARPEYEYGVFLSAAAVVAAAVRERGRNAWRPVVVAVVLAGAMAFVAVHSDAGRSGVAFAQHYNLRAANHGLIPQAGAWDSTYAYEQFGIDVHANGGRHSIGEFAKADAKKFLGHVFRNVASPGMLLFVLLSLAVMIAPWRCEEDKALRPASLFLLLIALPTYLSLTLVFPDRHYMAIVFPALLLLGLQEISKATQERIERSAMGVVAVAVAMMLFVSLHATPVLRRNAPFRPGLRTIECLRGVEREFGEPRGAVFDPAGIKDVYLYAPMKLSPQAEATDFPAWVQQTRPAWVLMTPEFEAARGMTDAQVTALLAGYAVRRCPVGTGVTVHVARQVWR